jgi:hypothetical protein
MGWTCSHPSIHIFPYMYVVIGYLHTTYHFISFPNPIICYTLLLIEIAFGYNNYLVRKNLVKTTPIGISLLHWKLQYVNDPYHKSLL